MNKTFIWRVETIASLLLGRWLYFWEEVFYNTTRLRVALPSHSSKRFKLVSRTKILFRQTSRANKQTAGSELTGTYEVKDNVSSTCTKLLHILNILTKPEMPSNTWTVFSRYGNVGEFDQAKRLH